MKYTSLFTTLFFCFLATFSSAQTTVSETIYFDFDSDQLTEKGTTALQSLAQQIQTYTDYNVEIIGHTDQDGSEEYNLQLSHQRAETVRDYLSAQGLRGESTVVNYLGESAPLAYENTPTARGENRRVTVKAELYSYNSLDEMVRQLLPEQIDQHTVYQSTATILTLAKGTEVTVPADAFCHMDGSALAADEVQLICKEAYSYTDMVGQRLFTQTADQMLETGGMVYLEARQNGKELKLQEGKSIELKLPEQGLVEGMEVFEGLNDSTGTIWTETGTKVSVEKEELFIQIDLSSLFAFTFEDTTNVDLTMGEMPDYPRPLRIAYPPNRSSYTQEAYTAAYRKYEEVMEAHHKDKVDLPERQVAWHVEAERRTQLLYDHKRKFIRTKLVAQLMELMKGMPAVQDRVSHHKLLASLNSVLDSRVKKIKYDERLYKTSVFKGAMADVAELRIVRPPNYQHTRGYEILPAFHKVISLLNEEIKAIVKEKNDAIIAKKFEQGHIDQSVVGRYVLRSSNLGWINCDRFPDLQDFQMMDLQFAKASTNQTYYLVFKNIKSMLRPTFGFGKVRFKNLPKGEDVRLISIIFENGKARMAYQDFLLGTNELSELSYKDVSVRELREVFEQT